MTALTNHGEELVLTWLLTASAATRPTALYLALHTEDPTETGAIGEVPTGGASGSAFELYSRKELTYGDPVADSGQALNDAAVTWTLSATDAGLSATHASVWDAASGGNCILKAAFIATRTMVANGVLTFNIGEIVTILD